MSLMGELLASDYPRDLARGMVVNFRIAGMALVFGLVLGLPLALALAGSRGWRRLVGPLMGVMRAAPTFVVMFFPRLLVN